MKMIETLTRNVLGEKGVVKKLKNLDLPEKFKNLGLKQLFKIKQYSVLGLDIGSSAVKIIQLHKDNGGYTVTGAGMVGVTNSIEDIGNYTQTNAIGAIGKCFQSTGIQTPFAVCSVCGPEVAVRYFKFPALHHEEIHGAVLLEASQVCPFNIDDASVHYQLTSQDQSSVDGVLVAATNKLVMSKRRLTADASLECVLMDVDGLALLNCFNELSSEHEGTDNGQTTAILNVGNSYTTLAIMGSNNLPFIRDITYAGNDIVKQIATEKAVNPKVVSRALSGCEDSGQSQFEFGDSLAGACHKLVVGVTETLRYYTAQEKSVAVEKILVCGGFSLVDGFVGLLDSQLDATVVLWNPFDKIHCEPGQPFEDIIRKNGPAMAVAAGLAMRSI